MILRGALRPHCAVTRKLARKCPRRVDIGGIPTLNRRRHSLTGRPLGAGTVGSVPERAARHFLAECLRENGAQVGVECAQRPACRLGGKRGTEEICRLCIIPRVSRWRCVEQWRNRSIRFRRGSCALANPCSRTVICTASRVTRCLVNLHRQ